MNPQQRERYSRQIRLPQIGEAGQQRLLESRALIVGMGGLGSPAAMYLAAAGVGELLLSDFDRVESSNLQRQIIHRVDDIGELKARSAQRSLAELNPECRVEALDWVLDDAELEAQVGRVDIVLDCCDNFATRFAVNRFCVAAAKPLISGAAIRMEGQVAAFLPEAQSACYQCLYSGELEHEESCALEGVLAPVVGVIGSMQALMAIRTLTGDWDAVRNKLLVFDAAALEWRALRLRPDPACPGCASRPVATSASPRA